MSDADMWLEYEKSYNKLRLMMFGETGEFLPAWNELQQSERGIFGFAFSQGVKYALDEITSGLEKTQETVANEN